MKKIKTKLLSVSAAALVASSFSSAAVQQLNNTWYAITYSGVFDVSKYAASSPLDSTGIPDGQHLRGPAGSSAYNLNPSDISVPVTGGGVLNVATGEIRLDPIAWQSDVVGGAYGYSDWSQTINGVFSGNVFTMSGSTVTPGTSALLCEDPTSNACRTKKGVGTPANPLLPPQTYTPAVTDEDGNELEPPKTVLVNTITFSGAIAPGVTGRYHYESNASPAFETTTLDITVGKVVYLPVPAAAWLFAPSLMALLAGKKIRTRKSAD